MKKIARREFLKQATKVAAAVAVSPQLLSAQAGALPRRAFGKTGLELPVLAYGGAALPGKWGNPLSTEARVALVRYVYERGVRYFDTGGNYLESQAILGKALKSVRGDVCLATKVETTSPRKVRKAVERSLKELETDYIDVIQIHGTPGIEYMSVKQAMKIHGELVKLRDEGIARFIGFSAHSYFDKALALISTGGFQHCMLSYGYLPRGHDQMLSKKMVELREACVAKADELDMAIVAMKVMGAGMLGAWSKYVVPRLNERRREKVPAAAIRYVLNDKRVHLLAIGMRLKKEVDANIKTLSGDTAYTAVDEDLLTEFCDKAYASRVIKRMRVD